jgi:hypothetical protein
VAPGRVVTVARIVLVLDRVVTAPAAWSVRDAGEFDGRYLLAIGVLAVVLMVLVLFAVNANPGSVH